MLQLSKFAIRHIYISIVHVDIKKKRHKITILLSYKHTNIYIYISTYVYLFIQKSVR